MGFVVVKVKCSEEFADILIAELSEVGYESFANIEEGFEASIEEENYQEEEVREIMERYQEMSSISYETEKVEKVNWNEEWEKNYEPIFIGDQCLVRASFHKIEKQFPYEIIINPKMSFGTGHHETTYLMLSHQLEIDHQNKDVMDAGCGTGILAIMASKRGATHVLAYDIDEWCVENSAENFDLNNCVNIDIALGDIQSIEVKGSFDIILANINKNVLLQEIPEYAKHLKKGGTLLLSGFYEHDVEDIEEVTAQQGFKTIGKKVKNKWTALRLEK
jgi:ribosomal protein L11 methyltransferase